APGRVPEQRLSARRSPAPMPDDAAPIEPADRPALVSAGRLPPAKDLGVAVRALALVPEATLTIAGDGGERAPLEALAAELGVAERVRFAGALPRADVLGLMAAADLVVLSSSWENFPHGLVEALAM